jgi:uncharacterized protein
MPQELRPLEASSRYAVLDLTRGFALFGVLIVNLLYFFRLPLFAHILQPHSDPGWLNHAVDDFVAWAIEMKAFDLFALTFGVGVAVQAERARERGANVPLFLARRFTILLVFGLLHITLVTNVDILTLFAVCGLALIPLLRLPAYVLAIAAGAAVFLPVLPELPLPPRALWPAYLEAAKLVYAHGSFAERVTFRWHETRLYILPLLIAVSQQAFGLMLGGMALWRSGAIRDPGRYRRMLQVLFVVAAAAGIATNRDVWIAIAYGSALLAWRPSERAKRWTAPFVAAGRMAFTNYLTQSLVFAMVFNGFGLFGQVPTALAAGIGVAFYALQLRLSSWWLARHRFGPFEWVWRSLTYGRRV